MHLLRKERDMYLTKQDLRFPDNADAVMELNRYIEEELNEVWYDDWWVLERFLKIGRAHV